MSATSKTAFPSYKPKIHSRQLITLLKSSDRLPTPVHLAMPMKKSWVRMQKWSTWTPSPPHQLRNKTGLHLNPSPSPNPPRTHPRPPPPSTPRSNASAKNLLRPTPIPNRPTDTTRSRPLPIPPRPLALYLRRTIRIMSMISVRLGVPSPRPL
jgi:hypothetical protein